MQITIPVRMSEELVGALDKHLSDNISSRTRSQLIRDILTEWAQSKVRGRK